MSNPVQIKYADDRSAIYASIDARQVQGKELSPETILEALLEAGFSSFEFQLDQQIMDELVQTDWERQQGVVVKRLAFRVEFDLEVQIARDKMSARITVKKAFSAEQISRERLLERLSFYGVKAGLIEGAIQEVLETGEAHNLLIAQGQQPEHGESGWVEKLLTPLYLSEDLKVRAEQQLLKIHPPRSGCAGYLVSGHVLPAQSGERVKMKPGEGCDFLSGEESIIVAAREGVVILDAHHVRVDSLLSLTAAQLKSARFLKSLEIQGDIRDLEIRSQGHIIVQGNVQNCRLQAGAEIVVRGRVSDCSYLHAGAHISVESLSETVLYCAGTLRVNTEMTHVQAHCVEGIRADTARCVGGVYYALGPVVLQQLGDEEAVRTEIKFGRSSFFRNRALFLQGEREHLHGQLAQILKRMIRRRSELNTATDAMRKHQIKLSLEEETIKRELQALQKALEKSPVHLSVLGSLYPGVKLSYQAQSLSPQRMYTAVGLSAEPELKFEALTAEQSVTADRRE